MKKQVFQQLQLFVDLLKSHFPSTIEKGKKGPLKTSILRSQNKGHATLVFHILMIPNIEPLIQIIGAIL